MIGNLVEVGFWRARLLIGLVVCAALFCPGSTLAQSSVPTDTADAPPRVLTDSDALRATALGDEAITLDLAGKPEAAMPLWKGVQALLAPRWAEPDASKTAERASKAAFAAEWSGKLNEASLLYLEAIATKRRSGFNLMTSVSDLFNAYGLVRFRLGERARAEEIWRALASHPDLEVQESALNFFQIATNALREAEDLVTAERVARAGLAIHASRPRVGSASLSSVHEMLGEIYGIQDRFASAEAEFAAALEISGWPSDKPSPGADPIAIMANYASILAVQGKTDAAIALLKRSQPAGRAVSPAKLAELISSANWASFDDGREREAAAMYRLEVTLREQAGVRKDIKLLNAIGNLAVIHVRSGDYAEAETLYRRELALNEAWFGADSRGAIGAAENLASVLSMFGRADDALSLYRRIWKIKEKEADFGDGETALTLAGLVTALLDRSDTGAAEELLRAVLRKAEAASKPETFALVTYYGLAAKVEDAKGNPDGAVEYLRKALSLDRSGRSHRALARHLMTRGSLEEARTLFEQALQRARNDTLSGGPNSTSSYLLQLDLAELESRAGDRALTDRRYAELTEATARAFGPADELTLRAVTDRAFHLLRSGSPAEALGPARTALEGRLAARDRLGALASRGGGVVGAIVPETALLVARAALASIGRSERGPAFAEAFAATQHGGHSAAADALARSAAQNIAERAGAGNEVRVWRNLQDQIAAMDAQIARGAIRGEAGDKDRQRLFARRQQATSDLVAAEKTLRDGFPAFFELIKTVPVTLGELQGDRKQGLLRADEALVLLLPGSPALPEGYREGLVFAISANGAAWALIPLSPEALRAEIGALHHQLVSGGETRIEGEVEAIVAYDRVRAHSLYNALFSDPAVAALLGKKSRWLLAPQGALMSLPFAALVTEAPMGGSEGDLDPARLRETRWLGLEKTLALLPSVSALRIQRSGSSSAPSTNRLAFLGIGDPAFSGKPDPVLAEAPSQKRGPKEDVVAPRSSGTYLRGAAGDRAALATLPRLPRTAFEIRALALFLGAEPGSVLLQLNASEAALRERDASGMLSRVDVLAFATHGLLSGELGGVLAEPALALSPPEGPATLLPSNDGLLTASEVATLRLSARQVILSACNTAAGGTPDADSLSGLARAFFYAGARSLIVSHFPVYDDAAERLTTETARISNKRSIGTADAMREAMQVLFDDQSKDAEGYSLAHPKAWAPFIVIDAQ